MSKIKKIPAAIYVRQADSRRRATQEFRCSQYAEQLGYEVTDCYWDEKGDYWLGDTLYGPAEDEWEVLITLSPEELGLDPAKIAEAVAGLAESGVEVRFVPRNFRPGKRPKGWRQRSPSTSSEA